MKAFRKTVGVPDGNLSDFKLVPEGMIQQSGGNIELEQKKGNAIRQHALDKQRKLLMVILQLAKKNLYTDELKIRLKDGTLLEANQFINLLNYALSPGKALAGVNAFVEVLHEAQVTPEMLINENVKLLLRNIYQKRGQAVYSATSTQTERAAHSPQGTQTERAAPTPQEHQTSQTSFDLPPAPTSFNQRTQTDEPPAVAGPSYQTSHLPDPPDEDFDEENEPSLIRPTINRTFTQGEYTPSKAVKRKSDTPIEAETLRRSSRARIVPNRLQVGSGWEAYDSDDEI